MGAQVQYPAAPKYTGVVALVCNTSTAEIKTDGPTGFAEQPVKSIGALDF